MGMDVCGIEPISPVGEYFRNNIWYWRPLWTYVVSKYEYMLPGDPQEGFCNDGYSLNKNEAFILGANLLNDIKQGHIAEYVANFNKIRADEDMVDCKYCHATGIRTDEVGISAGFPDKELDHVAATILGRTHGFCNACFGYGSHTAVSTWYHFNAENVREFALFLINSGGCSIY